MAEICQLLADWMILLVLSVIPIVGWIRGVRVYEAFVEGASEGFAIAIRLMPFLIAMLVAVNGLMASTAMGSTDTTFYILSVYFGAIGITRARYAPFVGVCGDIIGFLLSVWVCRIVFG